MCHEWQRNPQAFFDYVDMNLGEKPGNLYSIDRIDNDKGYEPGNLRWSTQKMQVVNRRTTVLLTLRGTTATLHQWAEQLGVAANTLYYRKYQGWTDEEILSTPIKKRNKSQTG